MLKVLVAVTLISVALANVCDPNPCNKGKCTVFTPANSKQLPYATCVCDKGFAGARCEMEDECVKKNPCTGGKLCSLDNLFKPVCACPLGYHEKDCKERLCTITEFKSKVFNGKVFIDSDLKSAFESLEKLATVCKVNVNVTHSFIRSLNPEHDVPANESALFIGHGIGFFLSSDGKTICDKTCLENVPLKNIQANCFVTGLAALGLQQNAGILQDKDYDVTSSEYADLKTAKQVGCQFKNEFPQVEPSLLVGKWHLVDSKNWDEFLQANEVGWWTRMALKTIKPDMKITNDGKKWSVLMTSTFKDVNTEFTEGVVFYSKSPLSGSKTKHICRTEGKNKLIDSQVIYASSGQRKVELIREIVGKQLVMTMLVKDVVCVRTYERS